MSNKKRVASLTLTSLLSAANNNAEALDNTYQTEESQSIRKEMFGLRMYTLKSLGFENDSRFKKPKYSNKSIKNDANALVELTALEDEINVIKGLTEFNKSHCTFDKANSKVVVFGNTFENRLDDTIESINEMRELISSSEEE